MPRRTWTIPPNLDRRLHGPFNNLARLIEEPIAQIPKWTADAEGTQGPNIRRLSGQVTDRLNSPLAGVWMVLWWLVDASGVPQLPNSEAAVTGHNLLVGTAGSELFVDQTDANGLLELDITISGAATRYVRSVVLGPVDESEGFAWT